MSAKGRKASGGKAKAGTPRKRASKGRAEDRAVESVTVRSTGARLHVRLTGPEGGPALVLLHGFPLNGRMWDGQVEELSRHWRVIVPDLRGHGRSEVGDGQYAIDFLTDDLFEVLDAVAPRDPGNGDRHAPVVACGLSMGGYVLLRAVERETERFRALVLADTRSSADSDRTRLKRLEAVRVLRDKGVEPYADMFVKTALGKTSHAERAALVDAVRAMVSESDAKGLIGAQLAMAARTDTTETLEQLHMPTLVIAGDEDIITTAGNAREMATRISGARLIIIPRAGHMTPLEAPGEFTTAMLSFLEGLPDPA